MRVERRFSRVSGVALLACAIGLAAGGCSSGGQDPVDGGVDGSSGGDGDGGHGVNGLPFGEGWYGLTTEVFSSYLIWDGHVCGVDGLDQEVRCLDLDGNVTVDVAGPQFISMERLADFEDGRMIFIGHDYLDPPHEVAAFLAGDGSGFLEPIVYRDKIEHGLQASFATGSLSNNRVIMVGVGDDAPNALYVLDDALDLVLESSVVQAGTGFNNNGVVQTAEDEIVVAIGQGYGISPIVFSRFGLDGNLRGSTEAYQGKWMLGLAPAEGGQFHLLRPSFDDAGDIEAFVDELVDPQGNVLDQVSYPMDPDSDCSPWYIGRIDDRHLVAGCGDFDLVWQGQTFLSMTVVLER